MFVQKEVQINPPTYRDVPVGIVVSDKYQGVVLDKKLQWVGVMPTVWAYRRAESSKF